MKQMTLSNIAKACNGVLVGAAADTEITSAVLDSRRVTEGALFFATIGERVDGHRFIGSVYEKGACCVVTQKEPSQVEEEHGVPKEVWGAYILVENTRIALAELAAAYFDYPAEKLKTIGITGTKGKTTTTYLVKSILESAGIKTGLIGTIESIIGEKHIPSVNTTPESYIV